MRFLPEAKLFTESVRKGKRILLSRVLEQFEGFHKVNLFLREMVPLVGFKNSLVYYERSERLAGDSHYPVTKMLYFAFDGITSLSIKPISMIIGLGMLTSFLGVIGIVWAIIMNILGEPYERKYKG